jgi:hypothetical protein
MDYRQGTIYADTMVRNAHGMPRGSISRHRHDRPRRTTAYTWLSTLALLLWPSLSINGRVQAVQLVTLHTFSFLQTHQSIFRVMTPVHLFTLLCYLCLMFISDIAARALGFNQH